MTDFIHPRKALFPGEKQLPPLSQCEHFCAAGNSKFVGKALALQAERQGDFDLTLDLEDGSAHGQEASNAQAAAMYVTSTDNRFNRVGVRIHDPNNVHWQDDAATVLKIAGAQVAYITVPKCISFEEANEVASFIRGCSTEMNLGRDIPLHFLIETLGALQDVWRIARIPNVVVLDFGQMDFVAGFHGAIAAADMRSPGQFQNPLLIAAKTQVVTAAIANGVIPCHNVTLDIKSATQTRDDARQARAFGFLRMWSIYPDQIPQILEGLAWDFSGVNEWAELLLKAQQANWGPVQFQSKLQDRATYRSAWEMLVRAHAAGVTIPEEARVAFFS